MKDYSRVLGHEQCVGCGETVAFLRKVKSPEDALCVKCMASARRHRKKLALAKQATKPAQSRWVVCPACQGFQVVGKAPNLTRCEACGGRGEFDRLNPPSADEVAKLAAEVRALLK